MVACLCAAWCRSCEAYRAVFEATRQTAGAGARWLWVDIGEHAQWFSDLDIETFPTLLVVGPEGVCFFGPLRPHAQALQQVVERAMQGRLPRLGDVAVRRLASALTEWTVASPDR
jgi:hypothetical protein